MAANVSKLPQGYALHNGYPSIEAYCRLRSAAGLTPKTPEQAEAALKGSWHGCYTVFHGEGQLGEEMVVAMSRVIGDGGWYFIISDMAVLPAHQRKGLGDVMLKRLLEMIREKAPRGDAYVSLGADEPGRRLYARNGFVDMRDGPRGQVGMKLVMRCGEQEGSHA